VSRDEADTLRERDMYQGYYYNGYGRDTYGNYPYRNYPYGSAPYGNAPFTGGLFGRPVQEGPLSSRGLFGSPQQRSTDDRYYNGERTAPEDDPEARRPRRVDPDYFWGSRRYN